MISGCVVPTGCTGASLGDAALHAVRVVDDELVLFPAAEAGLLGDVDLHQVALARRLRGVGQRVARSRQIDVRVGGDAARKVVDRHRRSASAHLVVVVPLDDHRVVAGARTALLECRVGDRRRGGILLEDVLVGGTVGRLRVRHHDLVVGDLTLTDRPRLDGHVDLLAGLDGRLAGTGALGDAGHRDRVPADRHVGQVVVDLQEVLAEHRHRVAVLGVADRRGFDVGDRRRRAHE